jgi:hypothetical protein
LHLSCGEDRCSLYSDDDAIDGPNMLVYDSAARLISGSVEYAEFDCVVLQLSEADDCGHRPRAAVCVRCGGVQQRVIGITLLRELFVTYRCSEKLAASFSS